MKLYGEFEIGTGEVMCEFLEFLEKRGISFNLMDTDSYKKKAEELSKPKKSVESVLSSFGISPKTTGAIVLNLIMPTYDSSKKLKDIYEEIQRETGFTKGKVERGIYNLRRSLKKKYPELFKEVFLDCKSMAIFLLQFDKLMKGN